MSTTLVQPAHDPESPAHTPVEDSRLVTVIREQIGQPPGRPVWIEVRVLREESPSETESSGPESNRTDQVRLGLDRMEVSPMPSWPDGWETLTERQWAIARLAGQGLTNRQIARRIFISPYTVKFHLREIFRKLSINSRVLLGALPGLDSTAVEPPRNG